MGERERKGEREREREGGGGGKPLRNVCVVRGQLLLVLKGIALTVVLQTTYLCGS